MKRLGTLLAVAAVTGAIGCTSMTPQQQGTVTGAAIGAIEFFSSNRKAARKRSRSPGRTARIVTRVPSFITSLTE